ncbi:MAG TPA: DNA-3-methyladenine glycosylase, partial [Bacteroidota bacterium]|nr:DNA-3-methyladenine glycosylase [Bacteroidota bacterium]
SPIYYLISHLSSKLPRSFYFLPTLQVARRLLGQLIVRKYLGKTLVGRIVEVEAYRGSLDPASHAYRGRTERNDVMFWEGGHLYVYFTYGMHYCANVVTQRAGTAEAVLIRGVEPVRGMETMRKLRGNEIDDTKLTNGPAKFCEAFGIKRPQNGTNLLGNEIYLLRGSPLRSSSIGVSTRVGIRNGTDKKWRFFEKGNRWVSK